MNERFERTVQTNGLMERNFLAQQTRLRHLELSYTFNLVRETDLPFDSGFSV